MSTTELLDPLTVVSPPRRHWRTRAAAAVLIALGLLLSSATQWSTSSLSDELALEFNSVMRDFGPAQLHSTNNPFSAYSPIASAEISLPDGDEPLLPLRRFLRAEGLSLAGAEPESWSYRNSRAEDGAVWSLIPIEPSNGRIQEAGWSDWGIDVTTGDDDVRILAVPATVLAFGLVLGGLSLLLLNNPSKRGGRRAVGGTALLIPAVHLATMSLRAMHQTKLLIESHVAAHGPLPPDGYDLAYMVPGGSPAEQHLADNLGVVGGLSPFGVGYLAVSLVLVAAAFTMLPVTRRVRTATWWTAIIGSIAAFAVYGPAVSTAVDILG